MTTRKRAAPERPGSMAASDAASDADVSEYCEQMLRLIRGRSGAKARISEVDDVLSIAAAEAVAMINKLTIDDWLDIIDGMKDRGHKILPARLWQKMLKVAANTPQASPTREKYIYDLPLPGLRAGGSHDSGSPDY